MPIVTLKCVRFVYTITPLCSVDVMSSLCSSYRMTTKHNPMLDRLDIKTC